MERGYEEMQQCYGEGGGIKRAIGRRQQYYGERGGIKEYRAVLWGRG